MVKWTGNKSSPLLVGTVWIESWRQVEIMPLGYTILALTSTGMCSYRCLSQNEQSWGSPLRIAHRCCKHIFCSQLAQVLKS